MNRMMLCSDAMRHAVPAGTDRLAAPCGRRVGRRAVCPRLGAVALAFAIAAPRPAFACASCGCALSKDAVMGYSDVPGWSATMELDFINQDQLRSGTSSLSNAQVAAINDAGGSQEVEKQTINRYITAGLNYRPNGDWNFNLVVPYIDRSHTTYGVAMNPLTPDKVSGATVDSLGDIRFITSYQGLLPTHNLGFQLGVILPTGDYGGPNADGTGIVGRNPVAFNTGPNARNPSPGNLLDTSLQAGVGATDVIVGAYYYQAVSQNFDAFISGQFQAALWHKLGQPGEDFRPGNFATVSFGVRYEENPDIVPQLQVNVTHKSTDQGVLADTIASGGTVVYLSPGVSVSVMHSVTVYGFVQLPLYSRLTGIQLFPHWTGSIGVNYAF